MKKFYRLLGISLCVVILLSGCLYPKNELAKNNIPNESQLEMVQKAVITYQEETDGLVPIKTMENDVDQYQKYLIDFTLLKEHQLITEIPGTAFENGGIYQYTIMTPEDDPKVKLIDLRLAEKIRGINTKIDIYRSKNTYPPFGAQIAKNIYKLNYQKLGFKTEPYVVSPFTQENLPIILNQEGEVFIDYRIDLQKAILEYDHNFEYGDDIRSILVEHYPFVPVYSLPYTIENDEVVFYSENE